MRKPKRPKIQLPLTEFGAQREDLDAKTFSLPDVKYYVSTFSGRGTRYKEQIRTYPEAMVLCIHLINHGSPALLYVEGPDQYGFNIPHNQFPKYLDLYNKLTGQTLRMPATYQPKEHSYDK